MSSAVQSVGAVVESSTVSVKPLKGIIVIVEAPEDPLWIVKVVGDAESEKSGVTAAVKLVVSGLPKPVTRS